MVDLRLGIVEYRDHPPQDTMVYRVYPLTGDLRQAKELINRLKPEGGGDVPEAVLAGVVAACQELAWCAGGTANRRAGRGCSAAWRGLRGRWVPARLPVG